MLNKKEIPNKILKKEISWMILVSNIKNFVIKDTVQALIYIILRNLDMPSTRATKEYL